MDKNTLTNLKLLATTIRIDTIEAIQQTGSGHIGGSLSIIELLTVLYGTQMRYRANQPLWEDRDQLVLSKGHAGPALYSTLANVGFFEKSELMTLNQGVTKLPSHPDRMKTLGVDATTGSLGQGTSVAAGIATGMKLNKKDNYVYLIVGDGELNEGQCWEAFQYLAHFQLNHCIVIIDENKKQLDGPNTEIMQPFDIQAKMQAFGFQTFKVQGNDLLAINQAIEDCKKIQNQAVCIVLDSIKGQGVPFFEKMADNHSVKFNNEAILKETEQLLTDLKAQRRELNNVCTR